MPKAELEWVHVALHDLCQPLTALECRLFLGLHEEGPEAMLQAMKEAMVECERLIDGVRAMQNRLN